MSRIDPFGDVNLHHIDKFDLYRGRILGLWACVESGIDQANYYGWIYTHKKVATKVPVSLGKKIKLFEEINRDLLPFEPLRKRAVALQERLNALVDDRHWMAHGYLIPDRCIGGTWLLKKNEFPKSSGGLETIERTFNLDELNDFRAELVDLVQSFTDYIRVLTEQIDKHGAYDKRS